MGLWQRKLEVTGYAGHLVWLCRLVYLAFAGSSCKNWGRWQTLPNSTLIWSQCCRSDWPSQIGNSWVCGSASWSGCHQSVSQSSIFRGGFSGYPALCIIPSNCPASQYL
jgi:hypothetical protein